MPIIGALHRLVHARTARRAPRRPDDRSPDEHLPNITGPDLHSTFMDLLDRIDRLAADLDRLRGHDAARTEIAAELAQMRRDADADIDTRRVRARALATILRRERSLGQTQVGLSLLALTAEYAS